MSVTLTEILTRRESLEQALDTSKFYQRVIDTYNQRCADDLVRVSFDEYVFIVPVYQAIGMIDVLKTKVEHTAIGQRQWFESKGISIECATGNQAMILSSI